MNTTSVSRRMSAQCGFTAVEILLVLAVIAIVAAMAVPAYNGAVFRAEVAASESDLESMASAIDTYVQANGALPEDLDEVGYGAVEDPWGNPYVYLPLAPPDAKSPIAGVPSTLVDNLQEFVQTEALAGRSHPEGQKLLNYFEQLGGATPVEPVVADYEPVPGQRLYWDDSPVNTDFDLYSKGENGKMNHVLHSTLSWDDVIRADNGEYYGLVSELIEW